MNSSIGYNYDFNYSINFQNILKKTVQGYGQESDFSVSAHKLGDYRMIKSKEIQQFYCLLIKQATFIKLGKQMQELIEIQFQLKSSKTDMEQQYLLREELCQTIKQINTMLGRQRQYYINLIVLFLMIIFVKMINNKHQIEIEKSVLFHFLHWELKGQHSTNIFYQKLIDDIVDVSILRRYPQKKPAEESIKQSLTFRQIQTSINLKQSTTFALAFNKENQNLNSNFKPCFKAFKKASNNGMGQTHRPSAFQKCMIGK